MLQKQIFEKPKWSDKFSINKPLVFTQFLAFLIFSIGFGGLIGNFINTRTINFIGFIILIFGIGIYSGIFLLLKFIKK